MTSTYHRLIAQPRLVMLTAALILELLLLSSVPAHAGEATGSTLVINGAGDGHGVGMSQEGAYGYAQHGYSYTQILAHYYTGTSIGAAPAGARVRVLVKGTVRRVSLESYVRGVVSAEMPSSWPMAALEAQAVASRTYALTSHSGGKRFDVYADSRSQVYEGVVAETARTNSAVAATAGQVVTYEGNPVVTYFFASSGGRTEDVQNAFLGALPAPWLIGVSDPYDQGPQHTWISRLSFASVGKRLKGYLKGRFEGIEVQKRGYSPRIISALVLGSDGPTQISGPQLAARLGLDATWAYFEVEHEGALRREPDLSKLATPPPGTPPEPLPETPAPAPSDAIDGGAPAGSTSTQPPPPPASASRVNRQGGVQAG